jgi:D-arabinose 1-dehydrogenase-like Zn-dependent alcohol dehydrogenase
MNYPDVLIIGGLYQFRPDPPFVPGSECAGVVTRVGEEITDFAAGDRVLAVTGHGAFPERVILTPPGHQIHHIPDDMPFDHAASFNLTYGTAYHGLVRRGALRSGESVLVLGASGGCGSAAVRWRKLPAHRPWPLPVDARSAHSCASSAPMPWWTTERSSPSPRRSERLRPAGGRRRLRSGRWG